MKLTKAEEQVMEIIWNCETAFLKDIMSYYSDPKPASTTIVTLLKRMQKKGVVAYRLFGNSRQYYPLIHKEDYFKRSMNEIVKNFFGNSALQFASFFTTTGNMSEKELEELKKIVEQELNRKRT
jgi:predicted transcriptional regulator